MTEVVAVPGYSEPLHLSLEELRELYPNLRPRVQTSETIAAKLRRAGVAMAHFDRTWDSAYISRFDTGGTVNDVIPVGSDLEPDQVAFILLTIGEELARRSWVDEA